MRRNRMYFYVSVASLLLIVLPQLAHLPLVVWLGLAILALLVFGWPRVRRSAAAQALRHEALKATVEPPTERHAYKSPTSVRALRRCLAEAGSGRLSEASPTGARWELPDGAWVRFEAPADGVTQQTLSLQGSSFEALAMFCDACARELGPMRLQCEGAELVVDGTRPLGQLLRDAAQAVELRDRRLRQRLRELEETSEANRSSLLH